jgi:hypothetical protein
VAKHLPVGTEVQLARTYLKDRGFKEIAYRSREVPVGQTWFVFTRTTRYRVILSEEARVIIESDGARLLKSGGRLFLHGI